MLVIFMPSIKSKKKNAVVFLDTKKKVFEDTLYFIDFIKFNKVEYEAHNHILKDLGGFNKKIIITKGGDLWSNMMDKHIQ